MKQLTLLLCREEVGQDLIEHRRSRRHPFRADVEIEWGSAILRASINQIGSTGMFIESSNPLWVGAEFRARVLREQRLEVNCVVRRVVPGNGMGVEFVGITEEARAWVEKLLETLAKPRDPA